MKDKLLGAVRSMKNNDQHGLTLLFDLYHTKLYFFCTNHGLATDDAEEIVQEVFIKLWASRDQIDLDGNIQSYIYTIAKHIIYDEFKKKVRRKAAEDYQIQYLKPVNNTEETMEHEELQQLVDQTLLRLPKKRRLAFELSRFHGMPNKKIAHEMGVSLKTVESHLTLALQSFRDILRKSEII